MLVANDKIAFRVHHKLKPTRWGRLKFLAETKGFEPLIRGCRIHDFESRAFNRSATSPAVGYYTYSFLFCKGFIFDFFATCDKIYITMKTFNEQVYDIVARIPAGRVASFGQIARMMGRPRMARFVGYASNNKNSWHLPWHRVVFKDGTLCGEPYNSVQYRALRDEGVKFTVDKRVKMDEYQWDPDRDGVPMDIRDLPLVF